MVPHMDNQRFAYATYHDYKGNTLPSHTVGCVMFSPFLPLHYPTNLFVLSLSALHIFSVKLR